MRTIGNIALAASIAVLGSACQAPAPHELSRGHVTESGPVQASGIPAPVRQSPFVPPPATREVRETYTVVVSEVPVKELLFALARDAGVDADIHPAVDGLVTLNAIDQPLDAILNRITAQLDIRSRRRNGVLVIEPDTPVLRSYRIDYVNVARDVRSRSSTATQVSAGGEGEASLGNNSSTDIDSLSSHRFWETIATAVRAIVLEGNDPDPGGAAAPEAEGAPPAGPGAALEPGAGAAVIPNPEAGILLVRTTARRHREVEAYLDDVLASARRQVLVETTIVEVELSERFQAGVDWERLARNDGIGASQRLLAGNLETPPFFALSYRGGSLGLTVRLLEEFGRVQVLSSPKLVVLNNQTAVLKAMRNIVYFEVNVETASGTDTTPGTARIDTDARTAPEGIMLAVTPHVSHADEIILNVRPTITRVNRFVNDPQPELAAAGVTNPVPELLVREMESVLRLNSGQTAILGGLMQDSHRGDNDRIPGLSDTGRFGAAFRFRKSESVKTELVIFIRPRVIRTPSVEADLRDFRSWLPDATGAAGTTHPSAGPRPLVGEQP
ncbi:MAG: type II and III secretion system protein [Thiotrichales bacterium]|nr:type II and III secretion system protein [Thiotrichales bacterium]